MEQQSSGAQLVKLYWPHVVIILGICVVVVVSASQLARVSSGQVQLEQAQKAAQQAAQPQPTPAAAQPAEVALVDLVVVPTAVPAQSIAISPGTPPPKQVTIQEGDTLGIRNTLTVPITLTINNQSSMTLDADGSFEQAFTTPGSTSLTIQTDTQTYQVLVSVVPL